MSTSVAWAYLVTLAVPFLTGLLTKASLKSYLKFIIAAVLSLVVGFGTLYATGGIDWSNWEIIPFLASLIGASEVYFRAFIDATGLKSKLAGAVIHD
jgi:glucan phosphoethanolaminetransferase (alkaline phosphatase superfamily)